MYSTAVNAKAKKKSRMYCGTNLIIISNMWNSFCDSNMLMKNSAMYSRTTEPTCQNRLHTLTVLVATISLMLTRTTMV